MALQRRVPAAKRGIAVSWRLLRGKSPAGTERRKLSGADPDAHASAKPAATSRIDDPSSTENSSPKGLNNVAEGNALG